MYRLIRADKVSFPDSDTVAAVNDIESLTTELSQKIWQKLVILDRYK